MPLKDAITEAEIKFTHFLVEHNCPLAAADHAGKLFRSMFLSSSKHSPQEIIKKIMHVSGQRQLPSLRNLQMKKQAVLFL